MVRNSVNPGITLAVAILVIAACEKNTPSNPVTSGPQSFGTIELNITIAPWQPVALKNAAVQAMDSVKVIVFSSTSSKITEQKLTQNGSRWQGSIKVAVQNNMRVALGYFGGSAVRYLGEKTGVSVTAGGSTTVDITVDYMGLWVTAPDSAGTDFKVRWTSRPYATGYVLQEDTKSDFSTAKQIYSGADTTYTVPISGKTHGQVYYYRARVNTAYGYGPWYSKGGASTLGNIPGTIIIDAPDLPDEPVPINFVSIQGGTFQMGNVENASEGTSDEKPVHTVTVSGFEMGVYEITNAQYAKYLNEALVSGDVTATSSSVKGAKGAYSGQEYIYLSESYDSNNKCWITYSGGAFSVVSGHEKWPVVYVTWYGSKSFALYYGFDLPTEAEWEYACRGGKQYKYGTYDGTISSSKANYNSNVGYPKDAGSYSANPYGLYDMSGNVWEWCHDWYGSYSSGSVTNPTGAPTGTSRVIRGGGWDIYDIFCRSAFRYSNDPDYGSPSVGFRVVRR